MTTGNFKEFREKQTIQWDTGGVAVRSDDQSRWFQILHTPCSSFVTLFSVHYWNCIQNIERAEEYVKSLSSALAQWRLRTFLVTFGHFTCHSCVQIAHKYIQIHSNNASTKCIQRPVEFHKSSHPNLFRCT